MKKFAVGLIFCGLVSASTVACDLCAVYMATEAEKSKPGFYLGSFEQFTHFGTLQERGKEVDNETGQYMNSFITQVFFGYRFNERFGLQMNIPYVVRTFKRPVPAPPAGFGIERGTENGLGDVSFIATFLVYEHFSGDTTLMVDLLGGVKFPTGASDRLKEEKNEIEIAGIPESGTHGHDLALGSGSFDGIVGGSVFGSWKRFFASARIHYAIRSEGAIGYQYANDLTWDGGPGIYLWLTHTGSCSLQCNISGETKGLDTFKGEEARDTGITAIYLGPELAFTWKQNLSIELGVDLPVLQDNTALQLVPDYRIRAGVTWRF